MTVAADHFERIRLDPKWRKILSRSYRLLLALVGGYFLTAAHIGFVGVLLPVFGANPGEAAFFGLLSGLVIYLGAAIWVAATRHIILVSTSVVLLIGALRLLTPFLYSVGA